MLQNILKAFIDNTDVSAKFRQIAYWCYRRFSEVSSNCLSTIKELTSSYVGETGLSYGVGCQKSL